MSEKANGERRDRTGFLVRERDETGARKGRNWCARNKWGRKAGEKEGRKERKKRKKKKKRGKVVELSLRRLDDGAVYLPVLLFSSSAAPSCICRLH